MIIWRFLLKWKYVVFPESDERLNYITVVNFSINGDCLVSIDVVKSRFIAHKFMHLSVSKDPYWQVIKKKYE